MATSECLQVLACHWWKAAVFNAECWLVDGMTLRVCGCQVL